MDHADPVWYKRVLWAISILRHSLVSVEILIIKVRRPHDRLIFIMATPLHGKTIYKLKPSRNRLRNWGLIVHIIRISLVSIMGISTHGKTIFKLKPSPNRLPSEQGQTWGSWSPGHTSCSCRTQRQPRPYRFGSCPCNQPSRWQYGSAPSLRKRKWIIRLHLLTFNVRGPSYLGLTRSISWLPMPWLLTSPGHQQPWYWLCRIHRSRGRVLYSDLDLSQT